MMTKKIIIIAVLGVVFFLCAHVYNIRYHEKVKNSPQKYVYETYLGPANSVLIIEDLNYKDALIAYYDTIEKDPTANPVIEVPLKTLPQYEPVYVVGQTDDGNLIEVVSYYDRGPYRGGSYLRGWVYRKTVHDNPAPKSE